MPKFAYFSFEVCAEFPSMTHYKSAETELICSTLHKCKLKPVWEFRNFFLLPSRKTLLFRKLRTKENREIASRLNCMVRGRMNVQLRFTVRFTFSCKKSRKSWCSKLMNDSFISESIIFKRHAASSANSTARQPRNLFTFLGLSSRKTRKTICFCLDEEWVAWFWMT